MIKGLKHTITLSQPSNDAQLSARKHKRRARDFCALVIDGQTYPVEDWSFGGIMFFADSTAFGMGNHTELTLKFKLSDCIFNVSHAGTIVRKTTQHIAIEFDPLTADIRTAFQFVLDDIRDALDSPED